MTHDGISDHDAFVWRKSATRLRCWPTSPWVMWKVWNMLPPPDYVIVWPSECRASAIGTSYAISVREFGRVPQ